jgi:hypothetical protein
MNPQYEKQLEASVRRELAALGELPAPPALASRILSAIEQRAAMPWYRQSWSAWPVALRMASLAVLVLLFAGICFGFQAAGHSTVASQATGWFAGLGVIWKTLSVLAGAVVATIQYLGTGLVVGGVVLLLATYAAGIGLGTAYVRLAMARR